MRTRSVSALVVAAVVLVCGQGSQGQAPATGSGRAPRTAAEFDELFQSVKNWGRWGADDQLGAANLVTDAKRRQAAALVKTGLTVSLAHNPITEPADDNASPFEHTRSGEWT